METQLLSRFGNKNIQMEHEPDIMDAFNTRLHAEYDDDPEKALNDIKEYIEKIGVSDFEGIALNFVSSINTKESNGMLIELMKNGNNSLRYRIAGDLYKKEDYADVVRDLYERETDRMKKLISMNMIRKDIKYISDDGVVDNMILYFWMLRDDEKNVENVNNMFDECVSVLGKEKTDELYRFMINYKYTPDKIRDVLALYKGH